MAADLLYKVAYDEAVRALSEQQAAIESFRGRAGLLLSTAAVTTSVLGAEALQGDGLDVVSWLALACFVAAAVTSLAILWPRRWEVTASPQGLIELCIESAESAQIEDLHRDLSIQMHDSYLENQEGLEQLAIFFQMASGLLTIEVVLWISAVAARL